MKWMVALINICFHLTAYGTIYQVGPGKFYPTPNALHQANVVATGDTIEIDGGLYQGQATLAVWKADRLFIRGVNGRPHLQANGAYIWGKGIWVLAGDNIRVENIEFSGASVPDKNGAGIRLDGVGLIVRHCYFHDNENGILTSNPYEGDIVIEYTEFEANGYGDGFSHNLYIGHVNSLTFRFNYSHHAKIGHNLKSRADTNFILYNRIMDEASGNSSRLVDLSNGGYALVMGNLLMQGPNAQNNNLIGYGKEGLSNQEPHELYVINNTCVNKRVASCIFVDINDGTSTANVTNNIFAGTGVVIRGTTTSVNQNLNDADISSFLFVDEPNYDYDLKPASPAIDYGVNLDPVNGQTLTPEYVYIHPLDRSKRHLVNNIIIDAGAYEYEPPLSTQKQQKPIVSVFPNPASEFVSVRADGMEIDHLTIITLEGKQVLRQSKTQRVPLDSLEPGIYFIRVTLESDRHIYVPISKIN